MQAAQVHIGRGNPFSQMQKLERRMKNNSVDVRPQEPVRHLAAVLALPRARGVGLLGRKTPVTCRAIAEQPAASGDRSHGTGGPSAATGKQPSGVATKAEPAAVGRRAAQPRHQRPAPPPAPQQDSLPRQRRHEAPAARAPAAEPPKKESVPSNVAKAAPSNVAKAPPPPAKKETTSPAVAAPKPPSLDLASLEQRLKDTKAIGVMTKISLKNQVDDLLDQFRAYYQGKLKTYPIGGTGNLPQLSVIDRKGQHLEKRRVH
jgi:hypothetical protein